MKRAVDEKLINLVIERGKMNREQSTLILDKGITIYFLFLVIAVMGLITKFLSLTNFVILICLSFFILIITSIPYIRNLVSQKKKIDKLISSIKKGGK